MVVQHPTSWNDGQVLPGARSSTSNADTTGAVTSGVSRAVTTSTVPQYPTATVVDVGGARYRATLLEGGVTTEYLLWAVSTGPLAIAPGTVTTDGTVSIPTGTLTAGAHTDGTLRVVLTDNGGSDIIAVTSLTFVQGGTTTPVVYTGSDFTFDPVTSTVTFNTVVVSAARGDTFTATAYTLDAARFNWTRNDPTGTRFGWNGAHRKWEPYKGGAVKSLGKMSSAAGSRYVLSPVPTVAIGQFLPGSATATKFSMVRLGSSPGEGSYPVVYRTAGDAFSGILVVSDDQANATYNFATSPLPLAGVMGATKGTIVWNPAFASAHAGETVWYSPRDFESTSKGVVGSVLDTLYIAPVPAPTERPLLRIGNRKLLAVLTVATETLLSALTVPSGSVGVALSTGKIKLNTADTALADPASGSFNPLYLGATLHYDGGALNRYPQPIQSQTLIGFGSASLTIPPATLLPGVGESGLVDVPDGTGNSPNPALPVKPRPVSSGLVRALTPGMGDAYLYTSAGRVAKLVTVNWDSDLPRDIFSMPLDTAYVSLESGKVAVGYGLARVLDGHNVYFSQAILTPAQYPDAARVFSRIRDVYTFNGETFTFSVDGTVYNVTLTAGTYTTDQAVTLLTPLVPAAIVGNLNGYLYIGSPLTNGTVSIGFNETGCRAIGLPPGWYVSDPLSRNHSARDPNWLPDSGVSFGLYRSPNNLDGSQGIPDVRATYRVTDATLSEDIASVPYQLLTYPPREDIAGYDTGVFFALSGVSSPTNTQVQSTLKPWTDVVYQFDQSRFGWLSPFTFAGQVLSPVSSVDLGQSGVVPETFYTRMGGYLRVSKDGGGVSSLALGTDFLVPNGSGTAILINRVGPKVQTGYRGAVTGGTAVLTDNSVVNTAVAGDRLKVTSGASQGSYSVVSRTANTITVTPNFPVTSTGVTWELYRGVAPGAINPAVVGDAVYNDFNHLPSEPFEVRILTSLGVAGPSFPKVDLPTANSGHTLAARFTKDGANYPLTILTSTVLGVLANGVLFVPTANPRFSTGSFSVVVGTRVFTNGVDLVPVSVFTNNPTIIEYNSTTGLLNFGSSIAASYQSASVVYRQEVLPHANVPAHTGELSPFTGAVSLNASDITAHAGDTVYLVDLQTYEDVYLNPILGAFTFRRPMESGQLVEATYYRAVPDSGDLFLSDGNPVLVTEFLPVFVRREVPTRISQQLFSFNPTHKTLDTDVSPSVWVGASLVSYGNPPGVVVSPSNNTFSLVTPVPDLTTKVLITYAVYEANGGETSYTVSQGPVWRPPFRITAGSSQFLMDTDRTAEMVAGKILRLDNYVTYIQGCVYDSTTNLTTVWVFPAPVRGVGTLSPSEPPTNLLTDRPITPVVDPLGTNFPTGADTGFLPKLTDAYGLSAVPGFQTVTPGQSAVRFNGDLTRYAVVGHIIEMFGIPYLIAKSDLVDGTFTDITLGSPSPIAMTWTSGMDTGLVRISVRPVYPSGATTFVGAGAFVSTEPYEVVLFQGTDPGVTLAEGSDYNLDPTSGTLTLMQPRQKGLMAGSSLRFYRTVQNSLAPFVFQGVVQYPRVSASAAAIDPPSATNGRLHSILQATYTFDSPDSFYARSVPLPVYITETSNSIVRGVSQNSVGTNPSVGGFAKSSPSAQGSASLPSQRQDLVSRDRVTRTFLRYFNGVVSSFEQVLENITGNPVGDRDGKLRLWMGTGDPWTPPGYEDGITGALNPRNIWSDVWNSYRTSPIALIPSDPVTNPVTATLDGNGNPVGTAMDSATLGTLSAQQRTFIKNDVDDVVLTGLRDTRVSLTGLIHFQVTQYGSYQGLSSPSVFSRIFPELTYGFTTTNPGIGYDPSTGTNGVYSFGKLSADLGAGSVSYQSTSGQPIAQLSNPVRGNLTSVLGAVVSDRRARARVISYSPTGYLGTTTRPAFLATVLTLDQFPYHPDGTPDFTKLYSNSGTLFDLGTGDPTLHTPPFRPGDQVSLGTPDGRVFGLGYTGTTVTVGGDPVFTGVFVDTVLQGCIVTLKSYNGGGGWVSITDPNTLVLLTTPNTGTPLTAELGDTLFVVPTTGAVLSGVSDPPTTAQLGTYAQSLPGYRMGTDVNLDGRSGSLVDATLPSWSDPFIFGIKEITGQKPPLPLTNLQAQVTFQNGDTAPSNIPALRGQPRLDSGDYSLPYYGVTPTELTVLGEVMPLGIGVVTLDSVDPVVDNPPAPGYPVYTVQAVYPDEVLANDGEVSSDPSNPAVLSSTAVLNPTYTAHSGVGTVEPFDLVFIQDDTVSTLPGGSRGIHTVGAVTHGSPSVIEPPRFVSQSNPGHELSLAIENVQAHEDGTHFTGMIVSEDANIPGSIVTTFTLTNVPDVVFDDDLGGGALVPPVGGFNTFFTASVNFPAQPFIMVKVMALTGLFVPGSNVVLRLDVQDPNILLCVFDVSGDGGATFTATGTVFFTNKVITVTTDVPFFDFAAYGGGTSPSPNITNLGTLNFAIDLDAGSSLSYFIANDRLSIVGPVDPRSARPRGTLTHGGDPLECALTTRGGKTLVYDSFSASFVEVDSTINDVAMVNGGVPFTFLPRSYVPSTYQVGVFFLGLGFLKVMPFEGWGNTPIASSDITFSAAPSSRQDSTGAICTTIAITDRVDNTAGYAPVWGDNRFLVAPGGETKGSVSKILPGDIAVIQAANMDPFTPYPILNGKVGTHLVRGVVVPTTSTEEHQDTYSTPDLNGDYNGWLPISFPTVTAVDSGGTSVTVSEIQALPPSLTWAGAAVSQGYVFSLSGTVFVIVSETGLQSTNAGAFSAAIVSADYTTLNPVTGEFSGLSNYKDGLGVAMTAGQFAASVAIGAKVSGMNLFPVDPHGPGVPPNFPGYTSTTGTVSIYGFRTLSFTRTYSGGPTLLSWVANSGGFLIAVTPTVSNAFVYQKVKQTSDTFLPPDAPVYAEIPGVISNPSSDVVTDWDILNTPVGAAFTPAGARCFLPGTVGTVGYSGAAGIYVEPSIPTTANDLGSGSVNVVDAGNSLTPTTVGVRRLADYISQVPSLGAYFTEFSEVEIRRIRRFHDLGNTFAAQLLPLRYCYEIRRGITATATVSGGYTLFTAAAVDAAVPPTALVGGTATQLGDFTNVSVNVHPGDEVRFLDAQGAVVSRAEVVKVTGARTLTLSKRLTVSPGTRFEVYLKVPPVPHEQSNEELLGYATDRVVLSRVANYTAQTGGSVPTTVNVLEDTGVNFSTLNVAKDDIVLVDPAGPLAGPTGPATPPQRGRRPFGDEGVIVRPGSYTAGAPARADDNRGYYKVDSVAAHALTVSAIGGLAGGADVLLGTNPNKYAVYPTIHASTLPAGTHEGQMDLRLTRFAVGNSFTTTPYSVAPFSYRVIRPTKLLTTQTIELILSMRERMLSWMEEIRSVSFKYGTYYVFQRDRHVSDLGFTNDPESGRGLLTNPYLHGIVGRWDIAPFVNTSDCLSILDRRFWTPDFRLDTLTPPFSVTPYADFANNNGRPVLVDRVNDALDGRDKLRATRFSWLNLRTDRVKGTLAAIRRFDVELPKQQAEAEQALAAVQSVEKV